MDANKQSQNHPSAFSVARKKVRNKYKFKCAMCGEYHEHISVHHVFSKSKYPQYASRPENLIALCWEHHQQFHKEYENVNQIHIYNLIDYMCIYANAHPEHKQSIHKIIEEMFNDLTEIMEEIGGEWL